METLTPALARRRASARQASTCRHARIRLTTKHPTEFIDLTDRLEKIVANAGVRFGILNVQTLHTTTAVFVNEHEPLLADFQGLLESAAVDGARVQALVRTNGVRWCSFSGRPSTSTAADIARRRRLRPAQACPVWQRPAR